MKQFTLASLFFLIFTSICGAQAQEYVRFVRGIGPQNADLQVAVETFEKDGVTIDLYGVVHMADKAYYDSVQKDLDTYDAVLYEGVNQGTTPNKETIGLHFVQKSIAKLLGLTFQKDGIDYTRENLVHADIDIETLEKNMNGKKLSPFQDMFDPETIARIEPLLDAFGGLVEALLGQNKQFQDDLKFMFASELAKTDIEKVLPADMKKAIIDDRNQIVMDVLDEQLKTPKKKFAIFYGAAHNPDFAKRLKAQGFKSKGKRWKTAWKIGFGAELKGITPSPEKSKVPAGRPL